MVEPEDEVTCISQPLQDRDGEESEEEKQQQPTHKSG